jgi:hypothetical protein
MNILIIRKTNVDFGGKGTIIDLNQCLLIMIYREQIVISAPIHRYFTPFLPDNAVKQAMGFPVDGKTSRYGNKCL